jgi:hypothetical protein
MPADKRERTTAAGHKDADRVKEKGQSIIRKTQRRSEHAREREREREGPYTHKEIAGEREREKISPERERREAWSTERDGEMCERG